MSDIKSLLLKKRELDNKLLILSQKKQLNNYDNTDNLINGGKIILVDTPYVISETELVPKNNHVKNREMSFDTAMDNSIERIKRVFGIN